MVGKVVTAPCRFPSLSPSPQKGRDEDAVHTIDIPQEHNTLSQWGSDLGPRLRVIWAIILSAFVYDDSVVMGYEECADSRDSAYLLQHCSSFYATTIDREDDLNALIKLGRLGETDSLDHRPYNTGVLLLDGRNGRSNLPPKHGASQTDTEKCDLVLGASRDPAGLRLFLRFRTAYISESMAGHVIDAIQEALSSVRHGWQGKVKDLNLLSRASREQILAWNTQSLQVSQQCLPDLIDRASSEYPDAIACCSIDEQFTYRELHHFSTALSAHLLAAGVHPHTYVGLILDKTIWSVVLMLAVLRTGAACMPLDGALPATQASAVLREANASLILTTASSAGLEPHWTGLVPQLLEISGQLIKQLPKGLPSPSGPVSPSQPAFLMYTSGSTGAPKGVVQPHQDVVMCVQQMAQALQLHSGTRFLQFAAFSFDLSFVETFCTLSRGGCVCMPGNHDRLHRLAETATALRINTAFLTAAVLAQLHPDEMPSLRTLTVGGDVMTAEQVALWAARVTLNVSYGTTEAIMFDTLHAGLTPQSDPRNVGRSFGPRTWIVDPADHHRLLPIGAVGELVVQGGRLAQGYLQQPEKTAAVFIEAPTWAPTTSRCYKTGDLARYLPDGSLYLLGRKDRQVKLRGQRVELDDLEARLKQAADLSQGAMVVADVILLPDQTKQLVGFVYDDRLAKPSAASNGDGDAMAGTLFGPPTAEFQALMHTMAQKLRQSLSWLFIPAFIFPLLSVPKTRTGKIDRTRLRQAAAGLAQQTRLAYAVPLDDGTVDEDTQLVAGSSNKLTDLVCNWYAESLGIAPALVLPESNFFHLGGDSIKAMRLTRLARDHGHEITIRDIFSHPQPARLAASVLVPASETGSEKAITTKPSTATRAPFSLIKAAQPAEVIAQQVCPQLGVSFDTVEDALPMTRWQRLSYGTPFYFYVLRLPGTVDEARLNTACQRLMERHPALRTVFSSSGIQLVLRYGTFPLDMSTHRDVDNIIQYVDDFCATTRSASTPTHLPPTGFTIITTSSNSSPETHFILRLSHMQFDALSIAVIFEDLAALYTNPTSSPSPPGYSDVLHHRATRSRDEALAFWRQLLQGSRLPSTGASISATTTEIPSFTLETLEVNEVITPPAGITMATLTKAAWTVILARRFRTRDIVFGQTVHGRHLPDLDDVDRIVGPCLNEIPVRAKLRPRWTVLQLMEFLQAQHLDCMPYDDTEYPEIVEHCTDWQITGPLWSFVQYENVDQEVGVTLKKEDEDDGVKGRVVDLSVLPPLGFVFLRAFPMMVQDDKNHCRDSTSGHHGNGHGLRLWLQAPEVLLKKEEVSMVLQEMAELLVSMVKDSKQAVHKLLL
ncbi:nonribosomal peptide synthase [Aspergillus brasiliensis]|nr:nonribosomal peptide synthase [Aspergillus brasiliensis]